MALDPAQLRALIDAHGPVIRICVIRRRGSAPREAGAHMYAWQAGQCGTIGGGALEWQAVQRARQMLAEGRREDMRTLPLGPELGQCCGGSVTLVWEQFDNVPPLPFERAINGQHLRDTAPERPRIWIWGLGHVGRALLHILEPLDFDITGVDYANADLPHKTGRAEIIPAKDPARLAVHAPIEAYHFIATRNHDLDLALCDHLLRRGAAQIGLIGSATKWRRFSKRLRDAGHTDLRTITCPVGDPSLGRAPQAIALGVAFALLKATSRESDVK